jgi:hypothetical protein
VTVNGQQRCGEDPIDYAFHPSLGYIVVNQPPADTPEAPFVLLLTLAAGTVVGGGWWATSTRSRRQTRRGGVTLALTDLGQNRVRRDSGKLRRDRTAGVAA